MENNTQIIVNEILSKLKDSATNIKYDTTMPEEHKLERMNVLLDVMHYTQNIREYSQLILEHERKKRRIKERGKKV